MRFKRRARDRGRERERNAYTEGVLLHYVETEERMVMAWMVGKHGDG
jgi:hypothetical protein